MRRAATVAGVVAFGLAWAGTAGAGPWRCVDADGGTVLSDRAIGQECVMIGPGGRVAPTVRSGRPAVGVRRLSSEDEYRIQALLGAAPRCTDAVWTRGRDALQDLACQSARSLIDELQPLLAAIADGQYVVSGAQARLMQRATDATRQLTAAMKEAQRMGARD